ncbi:hypothetical protein O6R05_03055 [Peptoniphilus equinus]|uniref:DNA mismatch repair proteins mutS family domain-containing protein n=1 Tax=Peptoniphilus equinus TaxID=3016343 RepID=A0ABY7QUT1_9FIRM|nr:hypothetical protein [Peptoniphilus equinus]WBW50540.1 hypothetical protein O6R05_03055 [Peptoniphilus equinus]
MANSVYMLIFLIVAVYLVVLFDGYYRASKYNAGVNHLVRENFGKRASEQSLQDDKLRELYDVLGSMGEGDVDDITFDDLELLRLFKTLNHCDTNAGEHVLYRMLRSQHFDLAYHKALLAKLSAIEGDANLLALKVELRKLGYSKRSLVPLLRDGVDLRLVKDYKLPVQVMGWAIVPLLIVSVFNPFLLLFVPFLLGTNCYLNYQMNKKQAANLLDFNALSAHFKVFKKLNAVPVAGLEEEFQELNRLFKDLAFYHKALSRIGFSAAATEAEALGKMLDIIFLISSRRFFKLADRLNRDKDKLMAYYHVIGMIDAYLALVSYKISENLTAVHFDGTFKGEDLRHPLLGREQVNQSFDFTGCDILLTGSNASGKSTFLRTVGISQIFANAFSMAHGTLSTKPMPVLSAIDISDSLAQNMSYFMKETAAIKRMVDVSGDKLLLLDEIFKGTNTIDRISAAYATLSYLQEDAVVLAATHDIELTTMLQTFTNYHFEEAVADDDIYFDYRLKDGPATSRNAIRILELFDYPTTITETARDLAKHLEARSAARTARI